MEIKELKKLIEEHAALPYMVWEMTDESSWFIGKQYISTLSSVFGLPVKYVDSLEDVPIDEGFGEKYLYIYKTTEFKGYDKTPDRVIVVCDKSYDKQACKFPVLEKWQFVDYLKTLVPGINPDDLEWLITQYEFTYSRKTWVRYFIFPKEEQQEVFDSLYQAGEYKTISNLTIFDLSNAIMRKDKKLALEVLKVFPYIDSKPEIWLLSILLTNFRRVIDIQLNPYNTAEDLGMSSKQFYAIKKNNVGVYSNKELIDIYEKLTDMEYQYKFKELPTSLLVDYLICKVLGK